MPIRLKSPTVQLCSITSCPSLSPRITRLNHMLARVPFFESTDHSNLV